MTEIKTISSKTEGEYNDRNSRFIGFLFPCNKIENFELELSRLKEQFPDATHYCYSYRMYPKALQEMAHDDGEPGGTAGLPILNRMKSFEVVNAGLVVIRYFGGIKLGKPGLIRAYGTCAGVCLHNADILTLIEAQIVKITYPYTESNRIKNIINKYRCRIAASKYQAEVTLVLLCPEQVSGNLLDELGHYRHLNISFTIGDIEFMSKYE